LEAWVPTPGALPPLTAEGRAGGGAGGGRPLPPWRSGGITPGKILKFYVPNPAIWCIFCVANVNIIVSGKTALVRVTYS